MGLLDYEGLICGWCEGTNIGMVPVATVSIQGPALMLPLAYCRDCGISFVPPEGVIEEKRKAWGKAIREDSRQARINRKKAAAREEPPAPKEPSSPPKKEEKRVAFACGECGGVMSVDHTSEARHTTFVLWKCQCGHTYLEKRHRDSSVEFRWGEEPLDPEEIPEVGEDLS